MTPLPAKQPHSLPPAVFLMGPTAVGKTALALTLCEHFPFDLISVDSAMVYRGMNIGTAKPDAETLARVPHQLIDICDPVEAYSAARFCQEALGAMQASIAQGRVPLLVGGTMLYFRALQQGLAPLPAADPVVRQALEQRAEAEGWPALHHTLSQLDPPAAQRIHPHDPQRIQRALEVFMTSGRTLTELQDAAAAWVLPFATLKLALIPADRAVLHHRIAQRFDKMLQAGLLDEVAALRARGDLDLAKPSMRAVGYRQVWRFLAGELSADAMREEGIIATRQLAKRQLTWLRSEQNSLCFTDENPNLTTITRLIDTHLS